MPTKTKSNRKSKRSSSKGKGKISPFTLFNKYIFYGQDNCLDDLIQYIDLFSPARLITYLIQYDRFCILFDKYFNDVSLWSCKPKDPRQYFAWWRAFFGAINLNRSVWLKKAKDNTIEPIKKLHKRIRELYPILSDDEIELFISKTGPKRLALMSGIELTKKDMKQLDNIDNEIEEEELPIDNNEPNIFDDIRLYCSKENNQEYCSQCPLFNEGQALFDTNSRDGHVDVLFIAEGPGQKEAETGIPFTGRSGEQVLRPYINELCGTSIKWMMWNTVLCRPPQNRNPNPDEIQYCRRFLNYVLKTIKPKIIICVGLVAAKSLLNNPTLKLSSGPNLGYYYNDLIPIWLIPHPAYVLRNPNKKTMMRRAMVQAINSIRQNNKNVTKVRMEEGLVPSNRFKYNPITDLMIEKYDYLLDPNKFYLLDVQHLPNDNYIAIFVDTENKTKHYLEFEQFYYYTNPSKDTIVDMDDCMCRIISTRDRMNAVKDYNGYYGDLRVASRINQDILYAQSVFSNTDNLNQYKPRIYQLDIECELDNERAFPDPFNARVPVCIMTRHVDGEYKTFYYIPDFMDANKIHKQLTKSKPNSILVCVKNEKELLEIIVEDIKKTNPDIITGWNIFFDLVTMVNRMDKNNLDPSDLSPFKAYSIDPKTNVVHIKGYVVLDMLHLYKRFTYSGRESYKLGYIASIEVGDTKIAHDIDIRDTFFNNYAKYVTYNIQDVVLLDKLNTRLRHIDLCNDLRYIAYCEWFSTVAGQSFVIDSLLCKYYASHRQVAKNAPQYVGNAKYPGAYVHTPKGGIYEYIIDLDFASLYPSIIRTFNIGVETIAYSVGNVDIRKFLFDYDNLNPDDTCILTNLQDDGSTSCITLKELKELCKTKYILTTTGILFTRPEYQRSLIAECITMLLDKRGEYKVVYKKNGDKIAFIRQLAYKYLANSIYGFLGFKRSRFYNLALATAITVSAKEATISTIYNVENFMGKRDHDVNRLLKYFDEKIDDLEYVIYGDTDSLFIVLKDYLKDDIERIEKASFKEKLAITKPYIEYIENNVNDLIYKFFNKYHYINTNYLLVKQEWLGETMLQLPVKKRYALRVITPKGYELELKGLDIRRSDYPQFSKDLLQELINIIFDMRSIDVDVITDFVNKKKIELLRLIKERSFTISRPSTMAKPLKSYDKYPAHILGMLLWNELEFKYFTEVESKGYIFPLSGIDQRADATKIKKYNNFIDKHNFKNVKIVVPDDGSKLPDYYILNEDQIFEFCLKNRVNLLIGDIVDVFGKNASLTATLTW